MKFDELVHLGAAALRIVILSWHSVAGSDPMESASSILQESIILAEGLESVLRGSPGLETIAIEASEAVVGDKEFTPSRRAPSTHRG